MSERVVLLLGVMLGGSLGAAVRYLLGQFVRAVAPSQLPLATLVVNGLGCLAMGFVMAWLLRSGLVQTDGGDLRFSGAGEAIYLFVAIGVLGGWTTFSMFAWELWHLWASGGASVAFAYVAAAVVSALGALGLGLFLGRAL